MKKILKKLNILLDKKQKKIMVFPGFCYVDRSRVWNCFGVGMIYQAVEVITDPDILSKKTDGRMFMPHCNMSNMTDVFYFLMGVLILVFAVKNGYLFFQNKAQFKICLQQSICYLTQNDD